MFGVTSQQVTSLTKEMDDTQLDLDTKADRKDIVRIDKKCSMMPTSEELQKVRYELFDKVELFTTDNQ